MSYHYDGGKFCYSSEIENPAYTAGKNYEEPPEQCCGDCTWWEEPPRGAWGVCGKKIIEDCELDWCYADDRACGDYQ